MMKLGILLHVYHLEAEDWETLTWGDPAKDELGTGTKFIECLLDTPDTTSVDAVIFSGPSQKDGLKEGAYTKQFLLKRQKQLSEFPRLKRRLDTLSPSQYQLFLQRLNDLHVDGVIKNTPDEVAHGAVYFKNKAISQVLQIAAASHAPRCLKAQILARQQGLIDASQTWAIVASEICFAGTTADDIVIIEPPHRGDDAMRSFQPTLPQVIKPYFGLTPEEKKAIIQKIHETISQITHRQ